MTKIRAVIYARVSTEEQAKEGFSIAAQLAELQKYAEQHNFEIIDRYVDEGTSGKNIKGRPQLIRLLKDAEKQRFQIVMLYKLDRLARKLRDQLEISDTLVSFNIKLMSLKENFDTSTPTGMMTFQMFGMIAELERSNIIERGKLGQHQRAREGKYNGGVVLGYDNMNKELIINEAEALIVKKIFAYAEQGLGLKAITRRLNENGHRSKKDKPFSTNSIKTVLNNPIYIGKIRYNQHENWSEKRRKGKNPDYIFTDGIHQPIISQEQWDKAHTVLQKRSYNPSRSHTPYILSGVIKCPVCGHGMVPARSKGAAGEQYRYYSCGQFHNKGATVCKSNMIKAEVAEQQVLGELHRVIAQPHVLRKLVDRINELRSSSEIPRAEEQKVLESQIAKQQRKVKGVKDTILNHPDLADMFKPELLKSNSELQALQRRLEEMLSETSDLDSKPIDYDSLFILLSKVHEAIAHAEKDEQKALLRLLVKSIHISKDKPSRRESRKVEKIVLTFDFTIEGLHTDTAELMKRVSQYSDFVAPPDPNTLDFLNSSQEISYGDLMKSLFILPLKAIRFTAIDLHRAINLLHQHQPHELMRQGHAPEAQALLRAAQHLIGEPMAPSDDKHDMARPIRAELVDLHSQLLGTPELAIQCERDDMRLALHMRENAFTLALFYRPYLSFAQGIGRLLVCDLDHLKLDVRGETLGIFLNAQR
ncbi:recombinase family protein [Paenibacillus barcinonensis]|uniref:DNA invertase Pin-like site-specific DNA recombinase n=1 Tax=Paenibacillus barcinonensis TaxID=198119 RepID=A0A2V4VQW1_PAEBA|nr:DNA invertase Pin-like site-specific DNA recombinase [Paenibacillus barcinonensis]QKS57799.1 recombinase family protein [Paenibacillus barcinonensis]